MRYFVIEFSREREHLTGMGPKFSPAEKDMVMSCARKCDSFFDWIFGPLEKMGEGVFDVPFKKRDVQRMYVLLERLTRVASEKLDPATGMAMTTLREPEYWEVLGRELRRGDSIVFVPRGHEITPGGTAHELAHAVWNSFRQEHGVNHRFSDHFELFRILVRSPVKYGNRFHEWLNKHYKPERIEEELFCYTVEHLLYPPI